MIYTTPKTIRTEFAEDWAKIKAIETMPDNAPLPLAAVVESLGLVDALWHMRTLPSHGREWSLFARRCARQALHLARDPRSLAAVDVADRHARGEATDAELAAAEAVAWDAFAVARTRTAYEEAATEAAAWAVRATVEAARTDGATAAEAARIAARCARTAVGAAAEAAAETDQKIEFLGIVSSASGDRSK